MRRRDSRLAKIEKNVQILEEGEGHGYLFDKNKTNDEIIGKLNSWGIKVSSKEFRKWRIIEWDENKICVCSPNFKLEGMIDRLLADIAKGKTLI